MILKRLSFPILLFLMVCISCNKNAQTSKKTDRDTYTKNLELGFYWKEKQQYEKAFYYFEKAKNANQDANTKAYVLLQMAGVQEQVGDMSGVEASATEAYQNAVGTLYLPYIYNTLGIAYEEQGNYDEALKYYNKCKNSNVKELYKCVAQNNIAVVYIEKKEYPTAVKILENTVKNDSLKADKAQYAKSLDNLGYALYKTKNPQAIEYLNKAVSIRDSINNEYEKIASYIHLSEYYQDTNENRAVDFAQKAYQSATRINSPDDRIEALKFWITSAEPIQTKKLALLQIKISDSIDKVRKSAKNQFAKIKFDSRKAIEEKQIAEELNNEITIAFVAFIILAVMLVFFIRYRSNKRLESSVYNTETRIAKKVHDELANDVFKAMSYAENQNLNDPEKKETLIQDLDNLYTRTRNISQTNSEIDTGYNYRDSLVTLLNSFSSETANVIIKNGSEIDWLKIKKEAKITVYRVLQELMVNMKKYSECSIVIIGFENQAKHIQIKYSDNGKGINLTENQKKGLHNAENRIRAIKGTITFESETDKGFKATIIIPK